MKFWLETKRRRQVKTSLAHRVFAMTKDAKSAHHSETDISNYSKKHTYILIVFQTYMVLLFHHSWSFVTCSWIIIYNVTQTEFNLFVGFIRWSWIVAHDRYLTKVEQWLSFMWLKTFHLYTLTLLRPTFLARLSTVSCFWKKCN